MWKTDEELFVLARRELFVALVGDAMDKLGLQHQFLPPQIQPLHRCLEGQPRDRRTPGARQLAQETHRTPFLLIRLLAL